jgi:phage shock protein C
VNNQNQRLVRSRTDKMVAGVAGGLANYLAVDPVFVRLAFVALGMSGPGVFVYAIMWLIMPTEGSTGTTTSQAFSEFRQQMSRVGDDVRQVFVSGGPTRTPRFDPMTGQPIDDGEEIPINNVGGGDGNTAPETRRNRLLGVILLGVGAFIAINAIAPGLGRFIVPAILIVGGVLLIQRNH